MQPSIAQRILDSEPPSGKEDNSKPPQRLALSLLAEARRRAEEHKWIESEKSGRDLGDEAIRDWEHRYLIHFCKYCRLEHVGGALLWSEFEGQDFGRITSMIRSGDPLPRQILELMEQGKENLEIINWALDQQVPTEEVREILEAIDINRSRLTASLA